MARKPRIIPNELIDKSRLRQNFYNPECPSGPDIPHWKVRGLVRGLLSYFSLPSRWRALARPYLDVLEQTLLASVERSGASDFAEIRDGNSNDLVNLFAASVPDLVKSLLDHPSWPVLAEESNRLLPELEGYHSIQGNGRNIKRTEWLENHLSAILEALMQQSACSWMDCPRVTTVPDRVKLQEWAEINSTGDLRFHILAHHHGSSYSVVRDRFNRRTPRKRQKPR